MLKFVIRIRITHQPTARSIDGIRLDQFYAGQEVELGDTLADYLLAEGWAEPVPLDQPAPVVPFSHDDPTDRVPSKRETTQPRSQQGIAADVFRRRRKRRK